MKTHDNTITIDNLSHEGRGVGRLNGKTHFIANALPGETVKFQFLRKKSQLVEGVATDIENPADNRVPAKCPHYVACGGCSLQHLSSEDQLAHKQASVLEQLEHLGGVVPKSILAPLTGPLWQYRHKARLGVKFVTKKDTVLVGFRERNGKYLMDMPRCDILHPSLGEKITALRELIVSLSIKDQVAQLEAAVSADETILILRHLAPFCDEDLAKLTTFEKTHNITFYLQPGKPKTIHRLNTPDAMSYLQYQLPAFGLTLDFMPSDFTQVNPEINQKMVSLAIELLDPQPDERILDLFCGLGNFTLPLATKAKHVTGIEGSEAMVERGYHNAKRNKLDNVDFYTQDLTQDVSDTPWAKADYDKVLLDPARSGAKEILAFVVDKKPSRIVYVSCNPSTLARDAGILVNTYGYHLNQAGIMDMFPHTAHVESIAVFDREKNRNIKPSL
jgi:23S rRNA (uracil1939-C5)-methyltransferase